MAAEAVIAKVVEQLVSPALSWLQEEISLLKNVKPELENMTQKMQIIQTMVGDAESQSLKKNIVKLWLGKLQAVSYDMDDVLDEWSTRVNILERKEVEEDITSDDILGSSWSSFLTTCFSLKKLNFFSSVKQLPWSRDIALRIKLINENMNLLFSEMEKFKLVSKALANDGLSKVINHNDITRITTSSVDVSKVFGRDQDKDFLLSKLLSLNTEQETRLQVVSIVGAGGLGKTTLAQLVYNDDKVVQKFLKKRIWVCVSDPFDEVKVAQAILEHLDVNHTGMTNLQTLHRCIKELLFKEKFLLVLDDVWSEEVGKWERLSLCLKDGNPDSRILVTTRKEEVVRIMATPLSNILKPPLISDSECWFLMKQIAFCERINRHNDKLEEIGIEIAKKCNGLPLAAKTLGWLLNSKDTIQEWIEVLKSEIWKMKKSEIDLFPHIFLSYQELPSVLKHCFLILALFPKDTNLYVKEVTNLWMACGYLNPKTEQDDMVKMGNIYLKFLVSLALLEWNKFGAISMHDIMHDFALYLIGDELLSVIFDDNTESSGTSESTSTTGQESTRVRHLMITGKINQTPIGFDLGKVRTCILLKVPPNVVSDLVKRLQMVRLLNLQNCHLQEVPESIGNLIHLRMLNLSDNPLVELPETIGDLFNLQLLFLEKLELSSLPQSLGKLVNLVSLKPSRLALERAPESVEDEIYLMSLESDVRAWKAQLGLLNLGMLKDLNQLQGVLNIKFERDYDDEVDAKNAAIGSKKHLTGLVLCIDRCNVAVGVVGALQPPPNIQTLEITGVLPSWIELLDHLKVLHIVNEQISTLPALWNLKSLETIRIDGCHSLRTIDRKFLGIDSSPGKNLSAFPKLVELIIYNCYALTEFEDLKPEEEGDITVMPKLEILHFSICSKLVKLPFQLLLQASSLKKLHIDNHWSGMALLHFDVEVTDEDVSGEVNYSHSLKKLWMTVKHNRKVPISTINYSYITFLHLCYQAKPTSYLPPMGKLPYLQSLAICCFESVKIIGREFLGIDDEEFVAFPDLVNLEIYECALLEEWEDLKLEDEGKITVMPKLENLKITKCPEFHVMPSRLLSQLSSLKVLHLPHNDW